MNRVKCVAREKWTETIKVNLTLRNFRIGKGRSSGEIDLPVSDAPQFFTSSFKGLLRGSMLRACHVFNLPPESVISLLGREVISKDVEREGKIKVSFPNPEVINDRNVTQPVKLHGIRIDPDFKSVEHGALFTYEAYYPASVTAPLQLTFLIIPEFPLKENEVSLLVAGLNGLQWESFGGFGSRGGGIIEGIHVEPPTIISIAREYFESINT